MPVYTLFVPARDVYENLHSLRVHLQFLLLSLPSAEFSFVSPAKGSVYVYYLHNLYNADMSSIKTII